MAQSSKKPSKKTDVTEEPVADAPAASQESVADAELDALLEDIDAVLEENATEFVRAFIQKGGQ